MPVKKTFSKFGHEYFKTITTMLGSAFGLVAALAWNDLIKRIIDQYISPGSSVISQLIYAIFVTLLLVLVSVQLGRISARFKEEEDESRR